MLERMGEWKPTGDELIGECVQCGQTGPLIGDGWSSMGGQVRACVPCWMSYWDGISGHRSAAVSRLLHGTDRWYLRVIGGALELHTGEVDVACMCPCAHGAVTRLRNMTLSGALALCGQCVAERHVVLAEPYFHKDNASAPARTPLGRLRDWLAWR